MARRPRGLRSRRPQLDRLEARELLATFTVTGVGDSGPGSLRQAILDANAAPGADTIDFDIPGEGTRTIRPASALPTIVDPVTIDGTTQPGTIFEPLIELDGLVAGRAASGLTIIAGGSIVRGLAINRFGLHGIAIRGGGGNRVERNVLGLDPAGATGLGNLGHGVSIFNSSNNTIGGASFALENIISGNIGSGVEIASDGSVASGNSVLGNVIGAGATRDQDLGNTASGVSIVNASGNTVGSMIEGAGNYIVGNDGDGVTIAGGATAATGNQVIGNVIGDLELGNGTFGVALIDAANNTIGGAQAGAGNRIAFNGSGGVGVIALPGLATAGNLIRSNSIFANLGPGIDLGANGPTPNDPGDGDAGPNNSQNFPTLTASPSAPGVNGTLNSRPNTTYRIEFFADSAADEPDSGLRQRSVQTIDVTTNGAGAAAFDVSFFGTVDAGETITATATDPAGNTSEHSPGAVAGGVTLRFGDATYAVGESNGMAFIDVVRVGDLGGALSVLASTSDGTARSPSDYTSVSVTLDFAPGQATATIEIEVRDDGRFPQEGLETVNLTLSDPTGGAVLGRTPTAVLEIRDGFLLPGGPPEQVLRVAEGTGGTTNAVFTVRRSVNLGLPATVSFDTFDTFPTSTATPGVDYTPVHTTLNFQPGQVTQTVVVPILADAEVEEDESVRVFVGGAGNFTIDEGSRLVILDDDVRGAFQFGGATTIVGEAGGSAKVVVTRKDPGGIASIDFTTADGTARAGLDYTHVSGRLIFARDETSKTFVVALSNDALADGNETIRLLLSNAVGAELGDLREASLTIADDDTPGSIQLDSASYLVNEAAGTATLVLTRSGGQGTVSAGFQTADLTARAGSDYTTASGRVSFAPNQIRRLITVPIADDAGPEPPETLRLTVGSLGGSTIGAPASATVTIADNDGGAIPRRRDGDFDGDMRTDLAIYDQSTSQVIALLSSGGALIRQFGNPAHVNVPVAADFDGDGRTDTAIYDQTSSTIISLLSSGGALIRQFGNPQHQNVPIAADYDGDGKTDLAIYDQTSSTFMSLLSNGGALIRQFGNPADRNVPVAADFDGDKRTDLAIYDQTTSTIIALRSGGGATIRQFGNPADRNVPVAADFDGDATSDLAIYDQTTSQIISLLSGGGALIRQFGNPSHVNVPVGGDYDGDGRTDLGIYDQTSSTFISLLSNGGALIRQFGNPSHLNVPIPGSLSSASSRASGVAGARAVAGLRVSSRPDHEAAPFPPADSPPTLPVWTRARRRRGRG